MAPPGGHVLFGVQHKFSLPTWAASSPVTPRSVPIVRGNSPKKAKSTNYTSDRNTKASGLVPGSWARPVAVLVDQGLKGLVVWALDDNDIALSFYRGAGGRDVAEGVECFEGKTLKKIAFVWN